jgi:DNA-binding IscR family transcriptional regulator
MMNLSRQARIAFTLLPKFSMERMTANEITHLIFNCDLEQGKSLRVLRTLAKSGILKGFMGPGGGYCLAREPKKITWLQIIEAIDGPMDVPEDSDSLYRVARVLYRRVTGEAKQETLADLIERK